MSESPFEDRGADSAVAANGSTLPADAGDLPAISLPLLTLDAILSYVPDPSEEIWPDGLLCMGVPTAIIGAPGVGKSRLTLQAAICTILGEPFLRWQTKGVGLKWLFLQTENATRRLKSDLTAMTAHLSIEERSSVNENLRILDIMAMDIGSICMTEGSMQRERIKATLKEWPADIVVIDPLRDAGSGDLNGDADMTAACSAISAIIKGDNPRRVPLVVHHGRTGAVEASKVFGDDSGSFGRNSKVLFGWVRSQINVAPAGVNFPDTVIFGCGKCSDGPKWEPFAARLNVERRWYEVDEAFDLVDWALQAVNPNRKSAVAPSPEEVLEVVVAAGGKVTGGQNDLKGLHKKLQQKFKCTREATKQAVENALGVTIIEDKEPGNKGRGKVFYTPK